MRRARPTATTINCLVYFTLHVSPRTVRLDSSVAALSATLALGDALFACLRVHVMEPSTWVRNECKFSSFASAAARRMSRRARPCSASCAAPAGQGRD